MKISDNFWDSNHYNHPPLTEGMITHAEQRLGVQLPAELIELLKVQNGGYTRGFKYPMSQATSWADDHVPLDELFGIVPGDVCDTPQSVLLSEYMTNEWGLPPSQIILCGDGHWWITLDYRNGAVPSVSWIDVEIGEDICIAPNFASFIEHLQPTE